MALFFGPQYTGTEHNDMMIGTEDYDFMEGFGGNDSLRGGGSDDTLYGDDGFDYLNGGDGYDWLVGGSDGDTLNGGPGNDSLFGEAGADRFEFFADQGTDYVYDFTRGEDHIAVGNFVEPSDGYLVMEDLDTDHNWVLDDADDLVSYNGQSLTLDFTSYAPDGTTSQLILNNVTSLTDTDFI
jgi:Ca2+-binding RTX toxin-like protein